MPSLGGVSRSLVGRTLIVGALLFGGCVLDNPGVDPPPATLNFPIALALSSGAGPPRHLFVLNSNFDLRFNAGTLQSYDLGRIESSVAACADPPCTIDPTSVIVAGGEVQLGAFGTGLALSPSGDRLYAPVRSEGNLTYVDVGPDGTLLCGGTRCDDAHRRGDESIANDRGATMPGEPVGVAVGSLESLGAAAGSGDYVLVPDRSGRVSLFIDGTTSGGRRAPLLVHVVGTLPETLTSASIDPASNLAYLTSASTNEVGRVGVSLELRSGNLQRSFAYNAGSVRLAGVADGRDARDVRFDPDNRRAFILSRRPEAVVIVDLSRDGFSLGDLAITRVVEVGAGPSRLALGRVDGASALYAFVSCFDARSVYIIDADVGELVAVVRGFSGPFEVAVDTSRRKLYVADFRSSVVRIVDLAPLTTGGIPFVAANIGTPRPVEELE